MIVTEKELQGMCKRIDNMLFEPITKFLEEKEDESERKILKYEILKTADEVYQEWLKNKNSPPKPKEPTKEEILQKQLLETQNMLVELQYKLTNKALQSK